MSNPSPCICDCTRVAVRNPAVGIKRPPIRKLERFLSEKEIASLAAALEAEVDTTGNPYPSAAIKLLLLTGARRGEIAGLQWQNVDFDLKCLRLPDSKTGAKVIYLNEPAMEVLRSLPQLANSLYVIPGTRTGSASGAIDKVWARVRSSAGLHDVRLHDLRHSFASMGILDGLSLPIIGGLLGHKHSATTARYAHLAADPLRAANGVVGMRIAAAINRTSNVDNHTSRKIIPIPAQPRRAS